MATDVMPTERGDARKGDGVAEAPHVRREIQALLVAAVAALLVLSLASFRVVEGSPVNWIGPVGAFTADTLYFTFGLSAWAFALLAGLGSWALLRGRVLLERAGEAVGAVLLLLCTAALLAVLAGGVEAFGHPASGLLGRFLGDVMMALFGRVGAVILGVTGLLTAVSLLAEISWADVLEETRHRVLAPLRRRRALRRMARPEPATEEVSDDEDEPGGTLEVGTVDIEVAERPDRDDLPEAARRPGLWQRLRTRLRRRGDKADEDELETVPEGPAHDASRDPGDEPAWAAAPGLDEDPAWARAADSVAHEAPAAADVPPPAPLASPAAARESGCSGAGGPLIRERVAARASGGAGDPAPDRRTGQDRRGTGASAVVQPAAAESVAPGSAAVGGPNAAGSPAPELAGADAPAVAMAAAAVQQQPGSAGPSGGRGSLAERLRRLSAHGELPAVGMSDAERDGSGRFARSGTSALGAVSPDGEAPSDDVERVDTGSPGAGGEADGPEAVESWEASGASAVGAEVPPRGPVEAVGSGHEARPVRGEGVHLGPVIVESQALRERKAAADLERVEVRRDASRERPWEYPPLSFLSYDDTPGVQIDRDALTEQAAQLEEVLSTFKVPGTVTNILPGPVVTMFEFEPEPGIKVSKISGLQDDIAMALKAQHVRVIAPIPGKGCVGVEVPNTSRETVYLKEILADDKFVKAKSKLTMGLGKDIQGYPVVEDLAKMPHLLVAGTTGSGKSVAINAMITSILYNASPDDVRMILIDPKQLELAIYEGAPHLLLPVVTDPAKAATALNWAVVEMERRYTLLKEMKVRNVSGYNEKLRELRAQHGAIDPDADDLTAEQEMLAATEVDGRPRHAHMPMLVVVIDEFADLIMVAGKEVEIAVARLAQKARAAGIHVILATQRPSTDVITGLIKANFPTRMSFRLISGVDSRTVLDTNGAEALLGMGDMLYRPPGKSELVRVHGAWVDEEEIERVVDFLKAQRKAEYDESILQPTAGEGAEVDDDEPVDDLYDQAVAVVMDRGFASISMVQRELRVGYNRAARMVDHMEQQGIVGPATGGSSRRDVIGGAFG
ncbi:MAG: DNA translocase FtsK [Deltaproteobacteria bacterium]|nr:MAG: DNA translocase FtsK [Deltaproteobacteria bacterium]